MSSNEVVRLGITLICDHLINELTKKKLELKQKKKLELKQKRKLELKQKKKMEGRHGRPTRILCINCNICVNKMRRYRALELDTRVTTLLCSWVHPRIITEDDDVCEACKDLAMQQIASSCDNHYPGSSHKGHNHVCILCGSSILRRKSDKILRENPSHLQQSMINILESRIAPRQITVSDRICHPCWLRTQREARRYGNFTDDTKILPSSADPAPEESQEDDQPGPNLSVPSPNGQADVQRIDQESEQSSSSSTHSVPTSEIKVFCPKCDTDLSHMSEGIQQDQTKIIVARVYHYFEQEYEQLKKTNKGLDLTPLSKFGQRTALATGVSESTVREILQEEERRNADKPREHVRKRGRPRKRPRQMNSSNDDTDDTNEGDGQASRGQEIEIKPEAETVVVKLEPEEYNNVHAEIDPIAINVKVEPPDDGMNDTNEILATQPATKRKRINILTESGVTCSTQQLRQDGSSSTQSPSSHRLKEELDESSQLGEEDIKIEIEIGEEGFS